MVICWVLNNCEFANVVQAAYAEEYYLCFCSRGTLKMKQLPGTIVQMTV